MFTTENYRFSLHGNGLPDVFEIVIDSMKAAPKEAWFRSYTVLHKDWDFIEELKAKSRLNTLKTLGLGGIGRF